MTGTAKAGALEGVRVVELATVVAGPGAARYLADFGADVIKVEAPGGDSARRMGWVGPGEVDSYFWKLVNRNKKIVSLDLKADAGRAAFASLVADASVLVENMRPGKLEALGFGPDELLRRNPKLVILRVTGFGQSGPYANYPGFATIAEALSGFSNLLGEEHGPPLLPPIAVTDEVTALVGAFAALVALRHAERTGEGQVADVNLLTSMFQIMGPLPSAYAHMGYLQPRLGSGLPYTVPRGTYRCADGAWVAVSTSSESVAGRVLNLLGLGSDTRYQTFQARSENRETLETAVSDWMAARTSEEAILEFRRVDAAIAKVLDMRDIFADPHYRARNMLVDVDGITMQNVVADLSKTPGQIRHAGRQLGADTSSVLSDLERPQELDAPAARPQSA